jgi:hypothetical protein
MSACIADACGLAEARCSRPHAAALRAKRIAVAVIASATGSLVEASVAISNCGLDGVCEYACAHTGQAKNAESSNATATADVRGHGALLDLISSPIECNMAVNLKSRAIMGCQGLETLTRIKPLARVTRRASRGAGAAHLR